MIQPGQNVSKGLKSGGNYPQHTLQRNMTEVAGVPPNQMNVKKNNFFTEPDESMIQQSILL